MWLGIQLWLFRLQVDSPYVWFQKISIPPLWKRFALWPSLPSGFSKIGPSNLAPLPARISKIFTHPLQILLSLTEVNKEVVLFTTMPNFVSFMCFLLNCITDKRIPYANSLCAQVTDKFCEFHVFSVEFDNRCRFLLRSSHKEIVEKVLGHMQIKCKVA